MADRKSSRNWLLLALAAVLLLNIKADAAFPDYSTKLDPKPLCMWQSRWINNPIKLASNNYASGGGNTVTFYIRPTTAITNGVVDVYFPTGFAINGVTGLVATVTVTSLAANTDTTISVGGVTLPSTAGGYGPFGLITRNYADGNPVDMNLVFGSVAIVNAFPTSSNLAVDWATSGTYKIGMSGQTINFKPTISVDVWKHDVFEFEIDNNWTNTSPECRSIKNGDLYIQVNGTSTNDGTSHLLDCTVTAKTTASTT
jgi:hypothetical protein